MSNRALRLRRIGLLFVVALFAMGISAGTPGVLAQEDSLTVQISAEEDSGVTGTAVLTADGDVTTFDLELDAGEAGFEGHIFDSSCDDHQSATVFYAIEPVDETLTSVSTLDVSFDEITNGSYWIHVHKPGGERGIGVACGQITAEPAVGGTLPESGVGFSAEDSSPVALLIGMLLAVGLFGVGMRLRGRAGSI